MEKIGLGNEEVNMDRIERFHKHLDECQQCREQPFNLCSLGADLLTRCVCQEDLNPIYDKFVSENFWDLI